jgi:mono/diheme cytochrome c family protein
MFKVNAAALSLVLGVVAIVNISMYSGAQATAAALSPKAHAGQETFNHNCMQCHAVYQGQGSFGPNLEGEMKKPHHKNAAEIMTIVKQGKGKMPGYAEKLGPSDIDDLLAYIRTL